MAWRAVHKGKLLRFLESVDALGGYVVREPVHNATRRYDADSLAILPPSHQKDLLIGLQTWRCAGVSVGCAMAGMQEVLGMGPRPVPICIYQTMESIFFSTSLSPLLLPIPRLSHLLYCHQIPGCFNFFIFFVRC
jgi:hypothetical protein